MFVEIITPDKKIYAGEVTLVQLPGTTGSFEIMPNHAPIISTLAKGRIKIVDREKAVHYFDINSGVIEMQKEKIIILAE